MGYPAGTELRGTSFGPSCPQYGGQLFNASDSSKQCPSPACSEDCLTLNVWQPPSTSATGGVMFWVHGGGYTQGGSSEFNGSTLAAHHGVVVITCNYRLGPLGFLAMLELEFGGAANAGMLDQQQALRWARTHAASFGGNPGKVLLFGQSAGGGAVMTHLLMPASEGLFQTAVIESGGPFHHDLPFARAQAAAIVDMVGCGGKDRSVTMACMRTVPASTLVAAPGNPNTANHALDCAASAKRCTEFAPTVDGEVLPRGYLQSILDPQPTLPGAPQGGVMYGHNPDDAMLFMVGSDDGTEDPDVADPQIYAGYVNASLFTRGYLRGYPTVAAENLPWVLSMYPPDTSSDRGTRYTKNIAMLGELFTDIEFVCGATALAAALARLPNPRPSWRYIFDYNASFAAPCDLQWPAEYGVPHTAELSFFWGQIVYPFGAPDQLCQFTKVEASFAGQIGDFLAQFAAGGPPAVPGLAWPTLLAEELVLAGPSRLVPGSPFFRVQPTSRVTECEMWLDIWRQRDG